MQHLTEFLHSKKLPIKEILSLYCKISEKIDGSAFQYYNDDGNIIFGKRGSSPNRLSPNHITEFDILTNPMYSHGVDVVKDIPDDIQILNFEIFSDNNTHIVKYSEKFKNNMVLLSGYNKDGTLLDINTLCNIADKLQVSVNKNLWEGYLDEDIIEKICLNKDSDEEIWKLLTSLYCTNIDIDNIEGIVLTFPNRICKVQNPEFQKKILKHLSDEVTKKESINLEYIYDICMNAYMVSQSSYEQPISRLIELYFAFEYSNVDYFSLEKTLENLDILHDEEINIKIAQQYYSMFPDSMDDIQYPLLLKFILLVFRNKRAKFPLWCSLEYQMSKVNPFLDSYILVK